MKVPQPTGLRISRSNPWFFICMITCDYSKEKLSKEMKIYNSEILMFVLLMLLSGANLRGQRENIKIHCESLEIVDCLSEEVLLVLEDGLFEETCSVVLEEEVDYNLGLSISLDRKGQISLTDYTCSLPDGCAASMLRLLEEYFLIRSVNQYSELKKIDFSLKYNYLYGGFEFVNQEDDSYNSVSYFGKCKTSKCSDKELHKYVEEQLSYHTKKSVSQISLSAVAIGFRVNEDGSVSDVRVLNGKTKELDQIAIQIVLDMPNWTPALKNGKEISELKLVKISFLGRVPY